MTSPYLPQQPYSPQQQYPPQGYAPQGYAPQPPAPGYAPQGYAPQPGFQQPPAAAPPVMARGTIEDFLDQAGGGGQSVTKFFTDQRVNGHWLQLQVARDLMQSDVRPQLDNNKMQQRDAQGRPKWVLVIQCSVLGSSDGSHTSIFPDGACSIWLKGLTKEGLVAAMSTAGVQKPDMALLNGKLGGAGIVMLSAGTRAARTSGFSAAKLYNFQYTPNGRENEAEGQEQLGQVAQQASGFTAPATPAPPQQLPPTPPAPQQYAAPAAPPAPTFQPPQQLPPAPPGPAQYAPPENAPAPNGSSGYAPPPPPQMAPPANPIQYADPAQQYAQQAPPPPPQGYAPPTDPEKAATLARLQGMGG